MEHLDLAPLMPWVTAFTALSALGMSFWHLFTGPAKKNHNEIAALGGRLTTVEQEVVALQQRVSAVPGQAELHALALTLERIQGDLKAMRALMDGNGMIMSRLEDIVTRHEDHLLNGGSR